MLYLSQFNFNLKYILEMKIGKIDRLSKRLDQKVRVEKDNFFFFNNQQFITRSAQAGRGGYFRSYVHETGYNMKERKKKKRKEKKKKEED